MRNPADPNDKRISAGQYARRAEVARTAYLVEQDFRRLVEILNRSMEDLGSSDEEILRQLCSTKAVAERGLRLGRLLSKLVRSKQTGIRPRD